MSFFDAVRFRIKAFLWPGRAAAEREEEFRFHLTLEEMHRRAAGLDSGAARAVSRRVFGNVAGYQEEVRRMSGIERIRGWGRGVRQAGRQLLRSPGFTAAAIVTLTLGIGGVTAIGAIVDAVLLRPLPLPESDRLVAVRTAYRSMGIDVPEHSDAGIFSLGRFGTTAEALGAFLSADLNLGEPPATERIRAARVSAGFFSTIRVAPIVGRVFDRSLDRPGAEPVIVLSEGYWRRRFNADRGIVGTRLVVQGRPTTVLGVLPDAAQAYPGQGTQAWLPLALDPDHVLVASTSYRLIARLKPGVTLEAAQRDFQRAMLRVAELYPDAGFGFSTRAYLDLSKPGIVLRPLRDEVVGDVGSVLWVLLGTAGFVLLVAAANVATLFLVRAEARRREMAVRIALGAPRAGVVSHFLAEGVVLAAVGAGLALLLTAAVIGGWAGMESLAIPRVAEVRVNGAMIGFAMVIAATVALACSALPIGRIRSLVLAPELRSGGRGSTTGPNRQRARQVLVVSQVALAFALLAGSGLLARTYRQLLAVKPGFDPVGVLAFRVALPAETRPTASEVARFFESASERLRAGPGVRAVGALSAVPLRDASGISHNTLWVADQPERDLTKSGIAVSFGMGGAFEALGIPLVAGRVYDRIDPDRWSDDAIVNEEVVTRFWPGSAPRDIIGHQVRLAPTASWLTVVGVVGNVRAVSLSEPPEPTLYLPTTSSWIGSSGAGSQESKLADLLIPRVMTMVVRGSGPPMQRSAEVRRALQSVDPTVPIFEVAPLAAAVDASTARTTFTGWMLAAAAGVALLLGLIGVYGVIAYSASIRTRELGLRLALGARPGEIRLMMIRQGMALVGAGIVAGGVLTFVLTGSLRALLYGVSRNDPIVLMGVALTLGLAGLGAAWFPASRAGRVDPAVTLSGD